MSESLLTILKFLLLALLYLFFIRVLRAVWAELRAPRPAPAPAAAPRRGGAARAPWGSKNGSRLRVVEPSELRGTTYDLADELTVGRAGGCQVTIDDSYISQLHARLFRREGQLYVEDLGSTNGTLVNGRRITGQHPLADGDTIELGTSRLRFRRGG